MSFDAARFDAAWERYVAAIEKGYRLFRIHLGKGASPANIAAAEKSIGFMLPEDLRHLLSRHVGTEDGFILPGWDLFSPDQIAAEWKIWDDLRRTEFVPEGYTSEPEGPILGDEWWRLGWIPFCGDGGGNHLCLDLDPASGGKAGQVITLWHDGPERQVIAPSLTEFIELIAKDAEAGELAWDEEWGGVNAVEKD
ncbi:MAG: SMI1/KNR4 family protein [Hyphomonadaceae bacterium]